MTSSARRSAPERYRSPDQQATRLSSSLVICTRSRTDALRHCLAAVSELDPAPQEVIVVDNSAGDPEAAAAALQAGARYFIEPEPGLSRARNRGIQESRYDVVAFIDDDAIPCRDWLSQILAPYADERVSLVTGDTVANNDEAIAAASRPVRSLSSTNPLWFEIANFGGLGFGTNMSLRRRCCTGEALFDVRLGRGAPIWIAEESHAFTQLLARGYQAVHVPAAVVFHPDKQRDVGREAAASFAYWLLLACEFPGHRRDLLRFLFRRLAHKPLSWPRDPHGPGEIISSSLAVKVKAVFAGAALYARTRKLLRR